ncbi:extracellular solute-binding protein [Paenibacillus sp.]|uniref:extracellular solute-binding protein n=1 Tax=Paenibacillus sp. TaxID=58172 RepID=UPI002811CC73|nr:extracellular solute-binding protein [Paenibacillus sp.]
MYKKKLVSTTVVLGLMMSTLLACNAGSGGNGGTTGEGATPSPSNEGNTSGGATTEAEGPLKLSLYYADNATLPFKEDWLIVQEWEKRYNVDLSFEVIPVADYATKVSLALNTGNNVPDVILYQTTKGENASLALNGAIVPISDYADWTPNFNARVEEFGLQEQIAALELKDGKRYYLPSLFDKPFYDGGLILRDDLLQKYGLSAPKTFDDLYAVLKKFKEENPDSYPLTILAGPRVLYRMTMPSYGVSVGKNGASGTNTLSWDYEKQEYFPGAISDQYKQYMTYLSKLYKEGLLDPEMAEPIDGDKWAQKMATGKSFASYAYYDQIGGIEASATEEGFNLQMYPPLEGPAGAHHQPKSSTGSGILFPKKTAEREDFERIVRTIDEMFFSEEGAQLASSGVEGVTYTMDGDKIKYADDLASSADGIYKSMQLKYGFGADPLQLVWVNAREMTKYDENYLQINATVAGMDEAIQAIPPSPMFDDMTAEEAGSLQTPLADTFEIWADAFLTGKKDLNADWDQYVTEMKNLQIEKFAQLYNDNLKK